jgi:hypothetical protein
LVEAGGVASMDPSMGVPNIRLGDPRYWVRGGGDTGELGPPLEEPAGGLMRFSFCRLEKHRENLFLSITDEGSCHLSRRLTLRMGSRAVLTCCKTRP